MLFHMIFFILIRETLTRHSVGTAIFYNKLTKTDCWTTDDIVKLRARRSFERLVPAQVGPNDINAKYINDLLNYFHRALYSMDNEAQPHTLALLKESLYDTIGAHLRSEILPAVRLAYYAGYVPYRNARHIHDFYDDIRSYLNTQGLGWNKPKRTSQNWSNLTVAKILIGVGTFFDPCSFLITKRDNNACIHLPIPKHDDTKEPSAIALPFKTGGLVSLTSPDSKNVLLKYYTTASRCILSSSPEKCRHADFVSFNNALWHWMKRDVAPHLMDEKLYAAYGGILRIAASVQNYGKGLSRRNLFEDQDTGLTKWHPWRTLTDPYFYVNADWTPQLYVALVILTAISIYLLQMCYGYLCPYSDGCVCAARRKSIPKSATNVHMSLIPHRAVYSTETKQQKPPACKPPSLGSTKTQKVYDLNENREKLMPVIMSSEEESDDSVSSQCSSDEGSGGVRRVKSESPPKLETSMSQLTVTRKAASQSLMDSTRTVTGTYQLHTSESQWSSSESSTSRSNSSSSSKRRRHSSHDLAWARSVIFKHSQRSGTYSTKHDSDFISSTTPNSQR